MRSVAYCLAALALLAGAARAEEKLATLTVDEVAAKVGQKNVYFFDNNPRELWASGHVPGAKWVKYDAVTAADLPSDKSATLIFYCANEH